MHFLRRKFNVDSMFLIPHSHDRPRIMNSITIHRIIHCLINYILPRSENEIQLLVQSAPANHNPIKPYYSIHIYRFFLICFNKSGLTQSILVTRLVMSF